MARGRALRGDRNDGVAGLIGRVSLQTWHWGWSTPWMDHNDV